MNKDRPMLCPMSFANNERTWAWGEDEKTGKIKTAFHPIECTPNCAWAACDGEEYGCIIAVDKTGWNPIINTRPVEVE